MERDAEGTINLRALFAPRPETEKKDDAVAPAAEAAASKSPDAGAEPAKEDGEKAPGGGGPAQTMVIDFNEIDIENGFARFIDHTTKPPFSEDISRLAVTIKSLSNVMGRAERTTLSLQALVGSDGALDMRGDLSGLGESLRADLVAELRGFSLSSANPYADALTSWTVQRGKLQAKIHYHVEGDRITAEHDLAFNKLAVLKSTASSDEAKRKIGVPLGLAVALLTDSNGNIDFSLPLTRHAQRPELRLGRGDLGGGEAGPHQGPSVAVQRHRAALQGERRQRRQARDRPRGLRAGQRGLAPSTEAQLTSSPSFSAARPIVKLTLAPVVTAADIASSRSRRSPPAWKRSARRARLPDQAAALRAYYQQKLPDVTLPKTVGEQMALLAEREPVPEGRLASSSSGGSRRRATISSRRRAFPRGARGGAGAARAARPPRPGRGASSSPSSPRTADRPLL